MTKITTLASTATIHFHKNALHYARHFASSYCALVRFPRYDKHPREA
jgi:hypothetical protein